MKILAAKDRVGNVEEDIESSSSSSSWPEAAESSSSCVKEETPGALKEKKSKRAKQRGCLQRKGDPLFSQKRRCESVTNLHDEHDFLKNFT